MHGQRTSAIVAINPELAEFVHPERPTILSKTKLGEQDGASTFDPYCERYDQCHGRKKERCEPGAGNVEGAPHAGIKGKAPRGRHVERAPGELVDGHAVISIGILAASASARDFTTTLTVASVILG